MKPNTDGQVSTQHPALRIAVLAHVRHPIAPPFKGGMEAHSWLLTRKLARRGHQVTLLASADSTTETELIPIADEHYERRMPWSLCRNTAAFDRHLGSIFTRACHLIDTGAFDVVHNNSLHPLPLRYADDAGIPMLTSLHIPPFQRLQEAVLTCSSPAMRFSVTSHRQLSSWWGDAVPARASAVFNGIELDKWPFTPEGDGSAVWAGRITSNKGVHIAAEAAHIAGIPLQIAGAIEDQNYFELRVRPFLHGGVRYCGHLDYAALAELFGRASLLLFTPLWDEPFGLVAVEAMACGLPVACCDGGAVREVVGEAGLYAAEPDAKALASIIEYAALIPRAVPRRRVERLFDINRMLDAYELLYRQCMACSTGRSVRAIPAAARVG